MVQQIPVPLSATGIDWTGEDLSGQPRAARRLQLQLPELVGREPFSRNAAPWSMRPCKRRSLSDNEVWLTMEGGLSIPAGAVLGLRNAA